MGLDNGIIIKKEKRQELDIPSIVKISDSFTDGDIELCYWRKCWGIRDCILDILKINSDGEGYFSIEESREVELIIKGLYKFLNESYWIKNGDSIWEYEEIVPKLVQDIINLKWLQELMKNDKNIQVYFYDSY